MDDYGEAIRLEQWNPDYWYGRGEALFALKQNEKALENYSEAIRLRPKGAVF